MASATASAVKSWKVSCPLCGCGDEDNLTVDLNDLTVVKCGSCGEVYTAAAAVKRAGEQLRRWQAVAAWLGAAGEFLNGAESE